MVIMFTGHRDKKAVPSELERIAHKYIGAVWLQGGAPGFDTQVYQYAIEHQIICTTVKPNYQKYLSNVAPLMRNKLMVEQCDQVVALYDGRQKGGTFQAINYAKKLERPIEYLQVAP